VNEHELIGLAVLASGEDSGALPGSLAWSSYVIKAPSQVRTIGSVFKPRMLCLHLQKIFRSRRTMQAGEIDSWHVLVVAVQTSFAEYTP